MRYTSTLIALHYILLHTADSSKTQGFGLGSHGQIACFTGNTKDTINEEPMISSIMQYYFTWYSTIIKITVNITKNSIQQFSNTHLETVTARYHTNVYTSKLSRFTDLSATRMLAYKTSWGRKADNEPSSPLEMSGFPQVTHTLRI